MPAPAGITNRWTPEEDNALREAYGKRDVRELARELGRTRAGVLRRAQVIGLTVKRRWTAADDAELVELWGVRDVRQIAKLLKRTQLAVYWRAEQLELERGCPPGFEYLREAARRTGHGDAVLVRIMTERGFRIGRSMSRPGGPGRGRIVETVDVDEAIADLNKTAPMATLARVHGLSLQTLQHWFELARTHTQIAIPLRPAPAGVWRVPPEVAAQVMAWRGSMESLWAAAKRLGVSRGQLASRMAGLAPFVVGKTHYFPRERIEAVRNRLTYTKKLFTNEPP